MLFFRPFYYFLVFFLAACSSEQNDPYPRAERGKNHLYSAFSERPKHLDPVQSYSEDESVFLSQVVEPPLQYHYLKRPYQLIPATLDSVPTPSYFDKDNQPLPADSAESEIAFSVYELRLLPGIQYQPHPAFAVDAAGKSIYAELDAQKLRGIEKIADFPESGSRELLADDYIYQIKRFAHPRLHSPIFSMMAEHIVGLKTFGETLRAEAKNQPADAWLDLAKFPLDGVKKIDSHTFQIKLYGKYPQFLYWLAMSFFAPVPREVDRFYSQPGMADKNLTLDWYPVGTGAYMLTENNPNSRMVLERNPNFRRETYPCEGEPEDAEKGLLADCGQPLPMIDKAIYSLEKENIPYWNKFLQGYYDASGISSDSFDQAVTFTVGGDLALSGEMQAKGISLLTSVRTSVFYTGFNLLDPVVGSGNNNDDAKRARALRQAISIAIDQEEYISIFMNGRGIPAMSPLPPGMFGHREGEAGINPVVYDWVDGQAKRKPIAEAKRLLAEAGWPNGRNAKTGEPLILALDTTGGGMGNKSRLDWITRQFAKLDIQLVIRSSDYNRFQEKVRKGAVQLYDLGWNADYPDPENMFFLLLGSEAKVAHSGENTSNYVNPTFDALFKAMKNQDNTPERLAMIHDMTKILQHDAPWVFGFHPKSYTLSHAWLKNRKPAGAGQNSLKYQRIDVAAREKARRAWNQPVLWPLGLGAFLLILLVVPALISYKRREKRTARS